MMMPSSLLDLSQSRELSVISYILLLVAIFETINLRQQQAHDTTLCIITLGVSA